MPGALPAGRDVEARHLRRIRELEEEIRVLKIESDKQVSILSLGTVNTYEWLTRSPMFYRK